MPEDIAPKPFLSRAAEAGEENDEWLSARKRRCKELHTDRANCADVRQKQQTERNQGNLQKRLDIVLPFSLNVNRWKHYVFM
jgi:hypothetical protein